MELKDILAIGGKPGLFKFVSQAKNGIIVEGLQDKKRSPAYATDKVSALEDIAVFTEEEEVSLAEVFVNIFKKTDGGTAISHKSDSSELKDFFSDVLPGYDRERVYVSDIKKIFAWYNALHELGMVDGELKVKEEESKEKEGKEVEENKSTEKEDAEIKDKK